MYARVRIQNLYTYLHIPAVATLYVILNQSYLCELLVKLAQRHTVTEPQVAALYK